MKSATELAKEYSVRRSWKAIMLFAWADKYGAKADEWNKISPPVADDRRVYISIYQQIYEAIDSLPDNPLPWIATAVQHELVRERKLMDEILEYFSKFSRCDRG